MQNGIILSRNDFADPDLLREKLLAYKPWCVILDLQQATDLRMVEQFSKLEIPFAGYPMARVLSAGAPVIASVINQACEILNTTAFFIKTYNELKDITAFQAYFETFFMALQKDSQESLHIGLVAPASHFMPSNGRTSVKVIMASLAEQLGVVCFSCPMVSNAEASLAILDNPEFTLLEQESSMLVVMALGNEVIDLDRFKFMQKPILWTGLALYERQFPLQRELPYLYKAIATHDRVTIWSNPNLTGTVMGKIGLNGEVQILEELVGGKVGRIQEGYVPLGYFMKM